MNVVFTKVESFGSDDFEFCQSVHIKNLLLCFFSVLFSSGWSLSSVSYLMLLANFLLLCGHGGPCSYVHFQFPTLSFNIGPEATARVLIQ